MKRTKILLVVLVFYFTCMILLWRRQPLNNESVDSSHSLYSYEENIHLESPNSTNTVSEARESPAANLYFRTVTGTADKAYYYSAFAHKSNQLRLFGAFMKGLRNDLQCCFFEHSSNNQSFGSNGAHYTALPESKGLRYSAAFFTCQLPMSSRPYAVSLSIDHCKTPSNILPIVYPQEQRRQFTVCVTPLNFRYSKAYELVEMIELNRILGADFFTFYNYSTNYNVDKVLEYYKKKGLVEVLEWNLPMKVDTWPKKKEPVEIHYFAQLAASNDCLYRNMYLSKYVVFQDLDEFIIPRKHLTWTEMIKALPAGAGAYVFQCIFFRKEWPDIADEFSGKETAKQYKMNTLLKQKRESKFLGKTHRSKYIVDPSKIDTVGIHNIWRYRSGSKAHFVNPEFARMHHYRNWLNPNDASKGVLDDRIMAYKDKLLKNIKSIWESLKNVPLGPLDEM